MSHTVVVFAVLLAIAIGIWLNPGLPYVSDCNTDIAFPSTHTAGRWDK